ncbi:MAG TPA: 50S ribosomal protein L25 [Acidimicrobiia bacterium]|nr:50S ribosomal protein L25 [Acidimicrobiia bacterium]
MSEATLTADPRTETGSRAAGRYRREGLVPAVVYGLETEATSVTVNARELQRILSGASGANTLITLKVDGGDKLALARQIHRHPVKGTLVHVDFVLVRADQEIAADVPIHLEGEAEGAKRGGLLEQLMFSIGITALPRDIPQSIAHDVSGMEIGDQLHVSDLVIPAGVTVTNDLDELVVQITQPRGMEEEEAAEGEAAEGEAPAEGAAPAAAESSDSGE